MHPFLIPVADALPAIQAHLKQYPDDSMPPGPEELRKLVELTCRFVAVAEALRLYVPVLGPLPCRN